MNYTTYYELPQYVGSDKTSWLVVFNGAMAAIDAGIHEAKAEADANALNIETLQSSLSTIAGTVSTQGTTLETLASTVTSLSGTVNTITSLIGNGEPTTQDKTLIGAIKELKSEIDALAPGGAVDADDVSYDNTDSGLSATNVQDAIDEVVAALPAAGAVELQSGTLTAGQTSVVLTFAEQTIGSTSLIDVYVEDGINYTAIATTSTTVTLTFEAQAANKAVAVRVTN